MTYLRRALGDVAQVAGSGPYFLPDIYELDLGALPNFDALAAQPQIVGCLMKATDGMGYSPAWFTTNWGRVRAAGGSRYGASWFRGCYHFVRPGSGSAQADFLLAAIDRAGGFGDGDMAPAMDLEGSSWAGRSNQEIVDVSSAFAQRIKDVIGRTPVLYAGSLIRDRGITDHMGFNRLWSPQVAMSKASWSLDQYALWQYAGDPCSPKGYDLRRNLPGAAGFPTAIPGWGCTDMNVVMDNGSFATDIGAVRSILTGGGGDVGKLVVALLLGSALFGVGLALSRRRSGR